MTINRLFICEKPPQGKDLASALDWRGGNKGGYIINGNDAISWGIGHLLEQGKPQLYDPSLSPWKLEPLPVIPKDWVMLESGKDNPNEEYKYKQLKVLQKLIPQAKEIVIATDYDREGETIAWELLDFFNFKGSAKRMIFRAQDKKSLVDSYNSMVDFKETYPLYIAGLARMRADWLMGMNITMALSVSNGHFLEEKDVISVGRVQSPIVYLVVQRENEIKNFKPVDHFSIHGCFTNSKGQSYLGDLELNPSWCNEDKLLTNKVKANEIINSLKGKNGKIVSYEVTQKETKPPIGYTLDELQKEGINKYNFSSQEVLDLAQSLYEKHKLTSYPRTDSGYMPQSQFKDAPTIINTIKSNMSGDKYDDMVSLTNTKIKADLWNDKKVGAHHAIIPINTNFDISRLSDAELKIYDLICKRYLMQFLGNYKYESTKIVTSIDDYKFNTSGNVPKEQGWKIASSGGEKETSDILPEMKKGENVEVSQVDLKSKKTKPPAYYTEATLLADMVNVEKYIQNKALKKIIKKGGIGTNATRANHIENLLSKHYLKKEGKKIRATEKAFAVNDILPDEIRQPEVTAYWEEELNNIVDGKQTLDGFMEKQNKILTRIINKIKNQECQLKAPISVSKGKTYTCDKCESIVVKRKSKKTGAVVWFCKNDDCKAMYQDNRGKRGDYVERIEQPEQPEGDFPCFKCNKHQMILRRSKSKTLFWVCSDNKCGTFARDDNGKPVEEKFEKCESCNKETLTRRKKKDSNEHFWVCTDKKCGTFAQDVNGKPVFEKKSTCKSCSKDTLVRRKKKNSNEHFWVCTDKKCGTFAQDNNGKPVFDEKETCFSCNKKTLVRREKKDKSSHFWVCSDKQCGTFAQDDNGKPVEKKLEKSDHKCPDCEKGYLVKRNGKKGAFWGCNNYPTCTKMANDNNGSPEV